MGRNPSRSLIFKQNSGVVQFGADVEIAVQVKSDEKLRVRRRGGKNLHKVRRFLPGHSETLWQYRLWNFRKVSD